MPHIDPNHIPVALCIEDRMVSSLLQFRLRHAGYDVFAFRSPSDLLSQLQRQSLRVILDTGWSSWNIVPFLQESYPSIHTLVYLSKKQHVRPLEQPVKQYPGAVVLYTTDTSSVIGEVMDLISRNLRHHLMAQ